MVPPEVTITTFGSSLVMAYKVATFLVPTGMRKVKVLVLIYEKLRERGYHFHSICNEVL